MHPATISLLVLGRWMTLWYVYRPHTESWLLEHMLCTITIVRICSVIIHKDIHDPLSAWLLLEVNL